MSVLPISPASPFSPLYNWSLMIRPAPIPLCILKEIRFLWALLRLKLCSYNADKFASFSITTGAFANFLISSERHISSVS